MKPVDRIDDAEAGVLEVTQIGRLIRLTLSRPDKGNALSVELVAALTQAIQRAEADGTRVLVITAQGRNFCTGFDLANLDEETDDSLLARFVRIELMLQAIRQAPFATIAVAAGRVWGAGADLFAACESRWIVGDARFCFPGAGFGLILGTGRLADLVGYEQTRDWVSTSQVISTEEAMRSGLATRLVAADALPAALEFAATQSVDGLDDVTRAALRRATPPGGRSDSASDLALLVRSAARPGLKARIVDYRKRTA